MPTLESRPQARGPQQSASQVVNLPKGTSIAPDFPMALPRLERCCSTDKKSIVWICNYKHGSRRSSCHRDPDHVRREVILIARSINDGKDLVQHDFPDQTSSFLEMPELGQVVAAPALPCTPPSLQSGLPAPPIQVLRSSYKVAAEPAPLSARTQDQIKASQNSPTPTTSYSYTPTPTPPTSKFTSRRAVRAANLE